MIPLPRMSTQSLRPARYRRAGMPSAFVTGGSGFIGGALIERLRAEGWDVRALARSDGAAEKVRSPGALPLPGDLDDETMLRDAAGGAEVAFHAAAKVE